MGVRSSATNRKGFLGKFFFGPVSRTRNLPESSKPLRGRLKPHPRTNGGSHGNDNGSTLSGGATTDTAVRSQRTRVEGIQLGAGDPGLRRKSRGLRAASGAQLPRAGDSETIEKTVTGKRYGGVFVPWNISAGSFVRKGPHNEQQWQRAGLDSKTSTTGTELKCTMPGDFLEFLYNRMRVKELGAVTVTGLRENVAFPKQTGKAPEPGSLKIPAPTSRIRSSRSDRSRAPRRPISLRRAAPGNCSPRP